MKQAFLLIHTHKFGHSHAIFDSYQLAENDMLDLIETSCNEFGIKYDNQTDSCDRLAEFGEFFEIETLKVNEILTVK